MKRLQNNLAGSLLCCMFIFLFSCHSSPASNAKPNDPVNIAVPPPATTVPASAPAPAPATASEILNYKMVRNSPDGLLMKAFGDIQFGVKCCTGMRNPGVTDLPYKDESINQIEY